jgi:hypothetical protein
MAYNAICGSYSPILDSLALGDYDQEEKLNLICKKANNDIDRVMAWSIEGMLNLKWAIQLYSHSSHAAWLEPMKQIIFIYKDAHILLTVENRHEKRLIIDRANPLAPLTNTTEKTKEVLGAMKTAYEEARLSTELIEHHLGNIR